MRRLPAGVRTGGVRLLPLGGEFTVCWASCGYRCLLGNTILMADPTHRKDSSAPWPPGLGIRAGSAPMGLLLCWGDTDGRADPPEVSSGWCPPEGGHSDPHRWDCHLLGLQRRRAVLTYRTGSLYCLAVGGLIPCGVRTDGTVACWGSRHRGPNGGSVQHWIRLVRRIHPRRWNGCLLGAELRWSDRCSHGKFNTVSAGNGIRVVSAPMGLLPAGVHNWEGRADPPRASSTWFLPGRGIRVGSGRMGRLSGSTTGRDGLTLPRASSVLCRLGKHIRVGYPCRLDCCLLGGQLRWSGTLPKGSSVLLPQDGCIRVGSDRMGPSNVGVETWSSPSPSLSNKLHGPGVRTRRCAVRKVWKGLTLPAFPLPGGAVPSSGTVRVAVLFVDFPDASAEHSTQSEAALGLQEAEDVP